MEPFNTPLNFLLGDGKVTEDESWYPIANMQTLHESCFITIVQIFSLMINIFVLVGIKIKYQPKIFLTEQRCTHSGWQWWYQPPV